LGFEEKILVWSKVKKKSQFKRGGSQLLIEMSSASTSGAHPPYHQYT
jgi:hypothetical protein